MDRSPPRGGAPESRSREPDRGDRRHRRRRRGRKRTAETPAAATIVPEVSRLVTPAATAADVLSPAELAEMKQHLAFLRRYKEALRLKLNATEDLMVNGQREPTDRGVVRHLLGKVDRAVIEAAIAREPIRSDATTRARMLEGAVRLTADMGILLAYLETLAHVRSRAEAAQAFAEVVARIDFESLSATRVARLLQALIATFVDHERVQVLLGLLASPAFRRAFDASASTLPADVQEILAPLRAVHRRLLEAGAAPDPPSLLAAGVAQVLSAPDPVLRAHPEPLRLGLLELASGTDLPADLADRATSALLSTLPRNGRPYAQLALRRAAQLLQRHSDDRARAVLEDLRRAQPGMRVAERWMAALQGRRLGRVALTGGLPERGRLAPAFWLDGQRPVWLRTAPAPDAARLASETRLQETLALPGVAPVVDHGIASGIPYVAVVGSGTPWRLATEATDAGTAITLAVGAARILRALALAGVTLPDVEPERFLYAASPAPLLLLADLDGARSAAPEDAEHAHRPLATALVRRFVTAELRLAGDLGVRLERALSESPALADLIALLDRVALRVPRD